MTQELTKLEQLLNKQHFGVLSTIRQDTPHTTLIGFAVSEDLKHLIFFSREQTRKAINAKIHPMVSLYLDDTTNSPDDIKQATTVTAYGRLIDTDQVDRTKYQQLYLKKNPHMEFFTNANTIMKIIEVDYYEVVSNFQSVLQIRPEGTTYQIRVRQQQGTPVHQGLFRGQIIASDDDNVSNGVVIVNSTETLPDENPGAIILTDKDLIKQVDQFSCPIVYLKPEGNITGSVTVNGDLGLVIYHQIS